MQEQEKVLKTSGWFHIYLYVNGLSKHSIMKNLQHFVSFSISDTFRFPKFGQNSNSV